MAGSTLKSVCFPMILGGCCPGEFPLTRAMLCRADGSPTARHIMRSYKTRQCSQTQALLNTGLKLPQIVDSPVLIFRPIAETYPYSDLTGWEHTAQTLLHFIFLPELRFRFWKCCPSESIPNGFVAASC